MSDTQWGYIEGKIVSPFSFDDRSLNIITEATSKYATSSDSVQSFISAIEKTIEIYNVMRDDHKGYDDKQATTAKLKKTINGLEKAINELRSLDAVAQITFSQFTFFSERDLFESSSYNRLNSDPTRELEILLGAAKGQLSEINETKYARNDIHRYLVEQITKKWHKHIHRLDCYSISSKPWRDYPRGIITPEVSLWLVVKAIFEVVQHPIQDPSNYINQAIEHNLRVDEDCSE